MVREISAYADVKRQISFHREFKLSISQFVSSKLFHIEQNARYLTVKMIICIVIIKKLFEFILSINSKTINDSACRFFTETCQD